MAHRPEGTPITPEQAMRALRRGEYESSDERDLLLEVVVRAPSLEARDVVWLLLRPDRRLRETGASLIRACAPEAVVDEFVDACRKATDAAVRGATVSLFAAGALGLERRLHRLAAAGEEEVAETARRVAVEAPPSSALEPVYWEIVGTGTPQQRLVALGRLTAAGFDRASFERWLELARDEDQRVREGALQVLAAEATEEALPEIIAALPEVGYGVQQHLIAGISKVARRRGVELADRILPLMASGEAATRTAVLKILLQMPDRRELVKRYLKFSRTLAGWVRDRALESMREFGDDLVEPAIELLADPDESVRSAAVLVASSFEDPRVVPATLALLEDPDWWVRITAAESLGRIGDPRAVNALCEVLEEPETRWAAVEALGRIADPRALPALARLLKDPATEVRIEVLLALQSFRHPKILEVLTHVAANDPDRVVRARALEVAEAVAARDETRVENHEELTARAHRLGVAEGEPPLHALLVATRQRGASDLHVAVGCEPTVRLGAELVSLGGEVLTADRTAALVSAILTDEQRDRLSRDHQVDLCYYISRAGRYRANVFVDHKGINAVFRVIAEKPPTISDVGLPSHVAEIASYHQGLVLVCGPAGSGKTTTLAALVNLFNETRHLHVITLEDPVEFVHPFKSCLINQREVGTHTRSFPRALRAALREDPDLIVIGDLRDAETTALALTAAETGHIVFGTLNAVDAGRAVGRVISSFPVNQQAQVRAALADSLRLVIAQRLLPGLEPGSRVACFEILKGSLSVSHLIREDKLNQLVSAMQVGHGLGMQLFDDALRDLVRRELLHPEIAYLAASDKDLFEPLVSEEFLASRTFL